MTFIWQCCLRDDTKSQATKFFKIDKLDNIKMKDFHTSEDTIDKVKR